MSLRWVFIAGALALLALPIDLWLLPKPKIDDMAPEVAQLRLLRMVVQDWKTKHPDAPAPDLTSPEMRCLLGPDLTFIDAWGSPYLVSLEPEEDGSEETVVLSFGPDHLRGTLDDLRVPKAYAANPPAANAGTVAPSPLLPTSRPATR